MGSDLEAEDSMIDPSFKRGGEEEDKDDYEGSGRGGGGIK